MIFDIKSKRIVKDSSYWKLKVNEYQGQQRKQSDLIEELKYLIKESIEEQMIADVPVGTFLSGGVDSSIVTFEGHRINSQLETFSMGFRDSRYNELQYADELSNRYQIHRNTAMFERDTFEKYYQKLRIWYDEPFADTSAFPTHIVSKLAKEKVTVVLTGDGGDEVFGGYDRHKIIRQKEEEKGPDHLLVTALYDMYSKHTKRQYKACFWLDDLSLLLRWMAAFPQISDKELRKAMGIDKDYDMFWAFRRYYNKNLPPMTRVQFLDLKTYLPGDILTKVDRASMAVSLETRVPLLARKIVEFSFSLSEEDRCPNGEQKGLLKKAYEEEIGKKILYRQKQGFGMPLKYFGTAKTFQEYILEDIWHYSVSARCK